MPHLEKRIKEEQQTTLANSFNEFFSKIRRNLSEFFSKKSIPMFIGNALSWVVSPIIAVATFIFLALLSSFFSKWVSSLFNTGKALLNKGSEFMASTATAAKNTITEGIQSLKDRAHQLFSDTVKAGVSTASDQIKQKVIEEIKGGVDAAKEKVTAIPRALGSGLVRALSTVKNTIGSVFNKAQAPIEASASPVQSEPRPSLLNRLSKGFQWLKNKTKSLATPKVETEVKEPEIVQASSSYAEMGSILTPSIAPTPNRNASWIPSFLAPLFGSNTKSTPTSHQHTL